MPAASIYGRKGVSDFIACFNGRYIAIEAKGINGKRRADQINFGRDIQRTGGVFLIIDHKNVLRLPLILTAHGIGIGAWKGFKPCRTRSILKK